MIHIRRYKLDRKSPSVPLCFNPPDLKSDVVVPMINVNMELNFCGGIARMIAYVTPIAVIIQVNTFRMDIQADNVGPNTPVHTSWLWAK